MFDPEGPVLGLDPGLSRCGYGAVQRSGASAVPVASGVMRTPAAA
jgi:Holliday junction resolvasome RuvABC endonuclease subunit